MDPLTLAPLFADFGFPALMVILLGWFLWKLMQMHREERREWRQDNLKQEEARDLRAQHRDEGFKVALEGLTDAVRTNHK